VSEIHVIKLYGSVKVKLHSFWTLTLNGSEWSASRSGRFTPWERDTDAYWITDWLASELVWTCWRVENFCPCEDSNSCR